MQNSTGEDKKSGRAWLIAGFISLFCISLFWSVDVSVFYLLSGISVFCFFQYLRSGLPGWTSQGKKSSSFSSSSSYKRETRFKSIEETLREIQKSFASRKDFPIVILVQAAMVFIAVLFLVAVFRTAFFGEDVLNVSDSYYKGNEFLDRGEYDSAAYYYRIATLERANDPEIYYARGNAFSYLKRYDSAVILFDNALVLNPTHNDAQYGKGYALYQLQRYEDAIDATAKIMEYNPNDLNAMLLIGDCYYSQTQYEKAMEWYTPVYKDGYRTAILSHVMAYIYDTQGKTAEAIEFYKEALELDNTKVEIYSRLGELLPGEEGNVYRSKALEYSSGNN